MRVNAIYRRGVRVNINDHHISKRRRSNRSNTTSNQTLHSITWRQRDVPLDATFNGNRGAPPLAGKGYDAQSTHRKTAGLRYSTARAYTCNKAVPCVAGIQTKNVQNCPAERFPRFNNTSNEIDSRKGDLFWNGVSELDRSIGQCSYAFRYVSFRWHATRSTSSFRRGTWRRKRDAVGNKNGFMCSMWIDRRADGRPKDSITRMCEL